MLCIAMNLELDHSYDDYLLNYDTLDVDSRKSVVRKKQEQFVHTILSHPEKASMFDL